MDETGTSDPLLGYQADWTDPTTDHVWMGARWYQPSSGTFLTRDTYAGQLQTPFTLNRYTYAGNNPNRYWDPTGRSYEGIVVGGALSKCLDQACRSGITTQAVSGKDPGPLNTRSPGILEADVGSFYVPPGPPTPEPATRGTEAAAVSNEEIASPILEISAPFLPAALNGDQIVCPDRHAIVTSSDAFNYDNAAGYMCQANWVHEQDASCLLSISCGNGERWDEGLEALLIDGMIAVDIIEAALFWDMNFRIIRPYDPPTVYRGTTPGYPGSRGVQATEITPATTSPAVATAYATRSSQFGSGEVPVRLGGTYKPAAGGGYVPEDFEIPVHGTPTQFAARAQTTIPVDIARKALSDMGISVPGNIRSAEALSDAVKQLPAMSESESYEFLLRALDLMNS